MPTMLEHVLAAIPVYKQCYTDEPVVIVIDRSQVVHFEKASFYPSEIPVGTPISSLQGTVLLKSLELGERVAEERDASRFGTAYLSIASPIREDGAVVGAIGFIVPNTRLDTLRAGAADLSGVIQEMSATGEEITAAGAHIAERLAEQAAESVLLLERLKKAGAVLASVKEIAEQSQLLGLNAALEAARAGEHGLGFGVVSTEIRKLGEYSKAAVGQITEHFRSMEESIRAMDGTIGEIARESRGASAGMEEFSRAFEHIADVSQRLSDSTGYER
ncbi:methyl-accepting chemotaxis protein [Cohnella sp. JJ-181]|uniref:methyl-accepting chemotaxis protein n=1 Tax=Cohnella rhizoplanae TaxID=2974897 RepID=UPI0022FF7E84|nr:methyl-accepting chemotaxis protein [Cohnella sp. JJ-181]CAI6075366.1 Putative sensory transducer protein YfmS [Cohnella sp. JJ-181]